MDAKTRVNAMLHRQKVDRVPIFMWFHPQTARKLAAYLKIPVTLLDEALGNDIRQRWIGNNYAMEGVALDQGEVRRDAWGIVWQREGEFNQILSSPLSEVAGEQIAAYEFPADVDALVDNLAPLMPYAKEYFIGADISPCTFELYNRLRGMENALLDLALFPETVKQLFAKSTDFGLRLIDGAVQKYHPDWIWLGDDVGGQQNLLMNPVCWREMIKPNLAELVRRSKNHHLPVAYHSCGAVHDIIGDLIEIGVNVLNPLQCNCPGMELRQLHREFGAHLTFMGGVDTQELLPQGSAGQVYDKTKELLDIMLADNGSYILAASHTVPPETPLENIFAMYAAAGLDQSSILGKAEALRNMDK